MRPATVVLKPVLAHLQHVLQSHRELLLLRLPSFLGTLLLACCFSAAAPSAEPFVVVPRDDSTRVLVRTKSPIGRLELWAPEAIMSDRGACAIYPTGAPWKRVGDSWEQTIGTDQSYGPGNYTRDGDEIECVGVKFPADAPVSWTTRLTPGPQRLTFEIRLQNAGQTTIRRAGAAVCVKFLKADWWSDDSTFAVADGKPTPLAKLGRAAGDDRFEAYLLRDERFANPFYKAFWGINPVRLERPTLVSEHRAAGHIAIVSADRAYCMLSNKVNPCTDLMLAFGDVDPGAEATAKGTIAVESGGAKDFFAREASEKPQDRP